MKYWNFRGFIVQNNSIFKTQYYSNVLDMGKIKTKSPSVPLTPGVDPWGWPRVAPGHAAPPEELARARRALSSTYQFQKDSADFWDIKNSFSLTVCISFLFIFERVHFIKILEKALRAFASSSGGAACPGATRGQPQGSTPGVRGWFQGDLSEKKILWRTDVRTDAWTDRRDGGNSYLDYNFWGTLFSKINLI